MTHKRISSENPEIKTLKGFILSTVTLSDKYSWLVYQRLCLHYSLTSDLLRAVILFLNGEASSAESCCHFVWPGLGEAPRVWKDSTQPPLTSSASLFFFFFNIPPNSQQQPLPETPHCPKWGIRAGGWGAGGGVLCVWKQLRKGQTVGWRGVARIWKKAADLW